MGTVSDEIPPGPEEFPVPVIPATFSEESFVVPSSPGVPQATDLMLYFLANLQNILSVLPPPIPSTCEELPDVLPSAALPPSELSPCAELLPTVEPPSCKEIPGVLPPAALLPCEELSNVFSPAALASCVELPPAVEPAPCETLPDVSTPAVETPP